MVCWTTSREFHPNCRSDRAAQCFEGVQRGSTIVIPAVMAVLMANQILSRKYRSLLFRRSWRTRLRGSKPEMKS